MAADDINELTFEKIVLIEEATWGITAPAATATNPAINAYSMRSWPRVSLQIWSFKTKFEILFMFTLSLRLCA